MLTKKLLPEGITREERTKKLNEAMRAVKPEICVERARLVTESYKQTEGAPYILRRAHALSHILKNMTIFIEEDELIVGNHASKPRSAPLFPEFGSFDKKELDLMPVRKVDTLQITEEDKKYLLEEIYPWWKNKNTGDMAKYYINEKIMDVLNSPYRVLDPISRTRSGYGHYIPNIETVLKKGFIGIEQEAKKHLENLDILDPDYPEKKHFYEAILIIVDGIKCFAKRYADLARAMAEKTTDKRRKKELELIALNCDRVPYYPAESFYEALQSYWFTILIDYIFQNGSAISGGRFDQYMAPYYENDIKKGIIVREEARELLEALWVKHSDVIKVGTFNSARNNGGFATTINIVLSGVGKDGNDATSDFSYLCLDAESSVFNSEPNVSIRVSQKTPDEFLHKVLEILVEKEGGKLPLFNDDAIIDALVTDGASIEDARDYAIVGCVEPTPSGNTMGITNACYFNLAKCLELALNDGVCPFSGQQMGPKTGKAENFTSFDQVLEAYKTQVEYFADMMVSSLNSIEKLHAQYSPHIYCSMLLDGCIENGKDCTLGGAKYNYIGVQGVGVQDVGDSLTAIKKVVFEDKSITMKELLEALKSNFKGYEVLQQRLINKVPKYGNDIDEADNMVAWAAEHYCSCFDDKYDFRGGKFRPGLFCLSSNTPLGRQVGALPSGRLSGTPLADGGVSPKHGMDTHGPTAAAKSVAKINHARAVNGVNFNMKFLPSILKTKEDRQKLIDLIRGYFSLGGFHIQFNILTPEKLIDAQKHPERHRSLVVRVAGYSAFFVELDRDIQNEIIARTLQQVS
ncbi:MAG: glycyl radical protein [Clostridiaceae bacterium]|nr:glycyl radical protein [Clostridiaceae bacterium]